MKFFPAILFTSTILVLVILKICAYRQGSRIGLIDLLKILVVGLLLDVGATVGLGKDFHRPRANGHKMPGLRLMGWLVTLAVITSSLYIMSSKQYDETSQKWAFGALGIVIGYWLRPPK